MHAPKYKAVLTQSHNALHDVGLLLVFLRELAPDAPVPANLRAQIEGTIPVVLAAHEAIHRIEAEVAEEVEPQLELFK